MFICLSVPEAENSMHIPHACPPTYVYTLGLLLFLVAYLWVETETQQDGLVCEVVILADIYGWRTWVEGSGGIVGCTGWLS